MYCYCVLVALCWDGASRNKGSNMESLGDDGTIPSVSVFGITFSHFVWIFFLLSQTAPCWAPCPVISDWARNVRAARPKRRNMASIVYIGWNPPLHYGCCIDVKKLWKSPSIWAYRRFIVLYRELFHFYFQACYFVSFFFSLWIEF
jgi:hypothetical protein